MCIPRVCQQEGADGFNRTARISLLLATCLRCLRTPALYTTLLLTLAHSAYRALRLLYTTPLRRLAGR